jgi:hypothetical protein
MSGKHAGYNMVNEVKKAYAYQPMFWSDLGKSMSCVCSRITIAYL